MWSYDFVIDRSQDGIRPKTRPIVEEYSRECLATEIERSIAAQDLFGTLGGIVGAARRGFLYPRSDNGPEFIARAVKRWLEASGG